MTASPKVQLVGFLALLMKDSSNSSVVMNRLGETLDHAREAKGPLAVTLLGEHAHIFFGEMALIRRFLVIASAFAVTLVLGSFSGCGEEKKVETIQDSPEAKRSDDSTRKAMEDAMKTKAHSKAPHKAK